MFYLEWLKCVLGNTSFLYVIKVFSIYGKHHIHTTKHLQEKPYFQIVLSFINYYMECYVDLLLLLCKH